MEKEDRQETYNTLKKIVGAMFLALYIIAKTVSPAIEKYKLHRETKSNILTEINTTYNGFSIQRQFNTKFPNTMTIQDLDNKAKEEYIRVTSANNSDTTAKHVEFSFGTNSKLEQIADYDYLNILFKSSNTTTEKRNTQYTQ